MIALWYVEAGKYDVLPLDSRGTARFHDQRPELSKPRQTYVYYPGTQAVPENVAVKVLNRAHSLTAEVQIPKGGASGVLICHGSNAGGYSLFVKDNRLHYVHNYVGAQEFHLQSGDTVPEGKSMLRYEFEPTGNRILPKAKAHPAARSYITMASWSVRLICRSPCRCSLDWAVALMSAAILDRRFRSSTRRRLRSPA
jgi:arylsulfatase